MKTALLVAGIFGLSAAAACTPARSPQDVETTSAIVPSADAFKPPGSWEMTIADKEPLAEAPKEPTPEHRSHADTTASKRQSGLINLPSKSSPVKAQKN